MMLGHSIGDQDADEEIVWTVKRFTLSNNPEIPAGAEVKGRFVRKEIRKHRPNHTVYTGVLGGQPVFQLAAASSTKISAPPFAAGGL